MRYRYVLLVAALLAACGEAPTAVEPSLLSAAASATETGGVYLVTFHDRASPEAAAARLDERLEIAIVLLEVLRL